MKWQLNIQSALRCKFCITSHKIKFSTSSCCHSAYQNSSTASVKVCQAAKNVTAAVIRKKNLGLNFTTTQVVCLQCLYLLIFFFLRKTDQMIKCIMPAALETDAEPVTVCVEFEDHPCDESELSTMYIYEQNPTISLIRPTKSFLRWVHYQTHHKWTIDFFVAVI